MLKELQEKLKEADIKTILRDEGQELHITNTKMNLVQPHNNLELYKDTELLLSAASVDEMVTRIVQEATV